MNKTIWITRAQPGANKSAILWQKAGFKTVTAPLIEISPAQNAPLPPPLKATLLVTSKNALLALKAYTDRRHWPVIAVGNATASLALSIGFENVRSAQGNAADLIKFVLNKVARDSCSLAYLCGTNVKTDISRVLSEQGYEITRHNIYDNEPVTIFPQIDTKKLTHIALYSEMSAKVLVNSSLDVSALSVISISPAVDQIAKPANFKQNLVAAQAEEMAMITALSS